MIVIYKQSRISEEIATFFNKKTPPEIPFVDTTLSEVSFVGWRSIEDSVRFYIPESWGQIEGAENYKDITTIQINAEEVIVFTDILTLPLQIPGKEDINPTTIYESMNLQIGHGFKTFQDFLLEKNKVYTFEGLHTLSFTLEDAAELILKTSGGSFDFINGEIPVISGEAIIDENSELLGSSKVYSPCLIIDSIISNSIIYPGSVVIKSNLVNSSVEGSYILSSKVSGSTVDSSVSYNAVITNQKLSNSKLPHGTVIGNNERR